MKKIILFLGLLLMLSMNVYAEGMPSSTKYIKVNGMICEGTSRYTLYNVYDSSLEYYFLNPSFSYNLDFTDYYEIPIEGSGYEEAIEMLAYNKLIHKPTYKTYYVEITYLGIWKQLYKDKVYSLCSPASSTLTKERLEAEKMFESISAGPSFLQDTLYLTSGETKVLTDNYLSAFYIADTGGLQASLEGTSLSVEGSPGSYTLVLKRNSNGNKASRLYTDGTNYLMSNGPFPDSSFNLNVEIDTKEVKITVYDENGDLAPNVSYKVFLEDSLVGEYLSDEEGQISLRLVPGTYTFERMDETITVEIQGDVTLSDIVTFEEEVPEGPITPEGPEFPEAPKKPVIPQEPNFPGASEDAEVDTLLESTDKTYEDVVNIIGDKEYAQIEIIPEDTYIYE